MVLKLDSNEWLGTADVSNPSAGIDALLTALRAEPGTYRVRSGARTRAQQAMLYTWGRTVRNPDMERTGDPGPQGLGVYATDTATESNHLRRSDGLFYGVDVYASTRGSRERLVELALEVGLSNDVFVNGRHDVDHFEDGGVGRWVDDEWRSDVSAEGTTTLAGCSVLLLAFGWIALGGALWLL